MPVKTVGILYANGVCECGHCCAVYGACRFVFELVLARARVRCPHRNPRCLKNTGLAETDGIGAFQKHAPTCKDMKAWIVIWNCTVVGAYTSAVDAQVVLRALDATGCRGGTVAEVRMNTETETGAALLSTPA